MNRNAVLIVCNRVPYPLKDGGALAMYAMIEGWHQLGKEVHVLAMNTSRHRVQVAGLPPLFRSIASFTMTETDNDIRWSRVLKNLFLSDKPEHAQRFYNAAFAADLLRLCEKVQPAIVQLESIYLHEYVPAVRAQFPEIRVIQRLHNIEGEIWSRLAAQTQNPWKRAYLKNLSERITRYEERVWRESDLLLPITGKDASVIHASAVHTPQCVIPYGMQVSESGFSFPEEGLQAYHIGAMDWKPNEAAMDWMQQEIVPAVLRVLPAFRFSFAGRNMPERFLSARADSFCCYGEVPDAAAFIADKQILIVPLRSGSGLRVKTLEAMAAGKLVVSTSVGIQGIDALEDIHFLRADTAAEFAEKIAWAYAHPRHAMKIARNAFELVKAHHHGPELMKLLESQADALSLLPVSE